MHQGAGQREGEASLVVRLGRLEVTIVGPVAEASSLLQHLQGFVPEVPVPSAEEDPRFAPWF